jgi:hypothetical protein
MLALPGITEVVRLAARGYRTIRLELRKTVASVYTSPRTAAALKELVDNMTLYEGVRMTQILEAVYLQGKKDGAREAFEHVDRSLASIKREVPHQRPGRPRKR